MQVINNRNVYEPLKLTSWQEQVLEALESTETEKYPLSTWYLGALYALDNPNNPDRISQAAQSLRELVEKLSQVVRGIGIPTKPSSVKSTFETKQSSIEKHILAHKESYPGDWEGQTINSDLAKALTTLEEYLELSRQPTRAEKIASTVTSIDPMFNQLNSHIQVENQKRLRDLWRRLEGFAHHNSKTEENFRTCLDELEKTVFYLLAPITAQDQTEIQTILSRSDRSENDVEQMFSLIERRGANFAFFFKHAADTADATWLPLLNKRGYFADPPNAEPINDHMVNFPFWWPTHYLAKIADRVPDKAIKIVQQLPKVNNPRIYCEFLEIALQFHGEQSAQLKPKILEYTEILLEFAGVDLWLWTYKYADLLAHWAAENQISAALELTKVLVEFAPNPQPTINQKRPAENSTSWDISLQPLPRILPTEYDKIMSKGVRPLAEKTPYQVACLLIDATANMIHLDTHRTVPNKEEDASELWCERLSESNSSYEHPKATLVHTLTFACEQVYEKLPDSVVALDKVLRDQQWGVFKRLRQHLYAQYPNEQTLPWIQELILTHEEYHLWEHHYEFQQMIRRASEHFGTSLLTEIERTQIFDTILGNSSKSNLQKQMVEEFTEEKLQQRSFHRKQLKPFESLLFGEYATYFQKLEVAANVSISDENYLPFTTRAVSMSDRSPCTPEHLANLTDEELLTYINEWDREKDLHEDDSWVKINIESLAQTFQTVFKETIISDTGRLHFWIENRETIERPIYVRMMVNVMQAEVQEKNFDKLNEWLKFCQWVLSRPDQKREGTDSLGRQDDESREYPDWHNSRRAVCDFIGTCLKEEVNVPIAFRGQLANLLEMLCTQFDSWLDRGKRVLLNRDDPLTEGVNNIRSSALLVLVYFGQWLRRHDSKSKVPEVATIIEKRFALQTEYPLTPPEYAILGSNYPWIFYFNKVWAAEHKSDFFPQNELPKWLTAFSSFVCCSDPSTSIFEILRDDFDFALQHITAFKKQDTPGKEPIDILSQHLFHYYLWEMYPLTGSVVENDSCALLEEFYQQTNEDRAHWANLFDYIGRILRNAGDQLNKGLKDRTIAFFDWRFEVQESTELQQFDCWLQAESLDPDWRLDAYYKILKVCKVEGISIARQVEGLCELLPNHTEKVVECFAKLTDGIKGNSIYILAEEAKNILKTGLESSDQSVRRKAKRVHDNLLREGRSDLLYLGD